LCGAAEAADCWNVWRLLPFCCRALVPGTGTVQLVVMQKEEKAEKRKKESDVHQHYPPSTFYSISYWYIGFSP
jgi:hypothetical protein